MIEEAITFAIMESSDIDGVCPKNFQARLREAGYEIKPIPIYDAAWNPVMPNLPKHDDLEC